MRTFWAGDEKIEATTWDYLARLDGLNRGAHVMDVRMVLAVSVDCDRPMVDGNELQPEAQLVARLAEARTRPASAAEQVRRKEPRDHRLPFFRFSGTGRNARRRSSSRHSIIVVTIALTAWGTNPDARSAACSSFTKRYHSVPCSSLRRASSSRSAWLIGT